MGAGLAALLLATGAAAQEVMFGGELRPRFEIRDLVGTESPTSQFTSMRTRTSIVVALDRNVTAFVQLQDVRVFGEEGSTLADFSADGLDLHQGWVEMGDAAADRLSIRVGRQEAVYGGQRLVGAVNWAQQARSFDGARVRYRPTATVVVDGLAYRISAASESATGADESLYGVYSTLEAAGALDLYGLLHTHSGGATERDLYTLGGRWVSNTGPISWRVEGAYQAGQSESALVDRDIAAFMFGGRVGAQVADGVSATVWYDYLSGDNAPNDGTTRVFDTLFATNHKFYGYMDFFLNIPVATNQRGLQDIALKGSYRPADGHTVRADLHSFHLVATDGLASGHIGEELDLTYNWAYATGVSITGGASYFLAASDAPPGLGSPGDNQVWGYLMLDVVF
jgi:hypothetical protein